MRMKIWVIISAVFIGLSTWHLALAENEATFDPSTGILNIPKAAVGSSYYQVDMQYTGGADFTLTNIAPITSSGNDTLVGTWLREATQGENLGIIIFPDSQNWKNYDSIFDDCLEGGTYTITGTTINCTFDANGGCQGDAPYSTLSVKYTLSSDTLTLDFGNKITTFVRQ